MIHKEGKQEKCISEKNNAHNKNKKVLNELILILKQLRGENGCPWDKAQTHESLKPCLIEETYEVIDAIEKKDQSALKEELGDLLLQIVFHTNLAEEQGCFDMGDVIQAVCDKMIYRHPHVFSNAEANSVGDVLVTWEEMKKKEKKNETYTQNMKHIPKELPALMKSYKVQKKAANVGFDWDNIQGAFDKIKEETEELIEIYDHQDMDKKIEEVGDLLFAVVNAARFLKIDPEDALNKTISKFINRFNYIEEASIGQKREISEMTLEEMDALWEEAKKKFRKNDKKEGFF